MSDRYLCALKALIKPKFFQTKNDKLIQDNIKYGLADARRVTEELQDAAKGIGNYRAALQAIQVKANDRENCVTYNGGNTLLGATHKDNRGILEICDKALAAPSFMPISCLNTDGFYVGVREGDNITSAVHTAEEYLRDNPNFGNRNIGRNAGPPIMGANAGQQMNFGPQNLPLNGKAGETGQYNGLPPGQCPKCNAIGGHTCTDGSIVGRNAYPSKSSLTEGQIEQAARNLCEIRGNEPDEVETAQDIGNGVVGKIIDPLPNWKYCVPEIKGEIDRQQIEDAISSVFNHSRFELMGRNAYKAKTDA